MPQTDNRTDHGGSHPTCAQCGGQGGEFADDMDPNPGWGPCYHCRTTGLCDCEECHPPTEVAALTEHDWHTLETLLPRELSERVKALICTPATGQEKGWAVSIVLPIYNNMDGFVGSTTRLAAIFTDKESAEEWCRWPDGLHEARTEIKPVTFALGEAAHA